MARDCSSEITPTLAALMRDPDSISPEDAGQFLTQGLHRDTDLITDPATFEVLCAALADYWGPLPEDSRAGDAESA